MTARLMRVYEGDFARTEAAVNGAFEAAERAWPESGTRAWLAAAAHSDGPTTDDDYLRLIFLCCHPALRLEAQVALVLRSLCGFTTAEIASAFGVEPAALEQRMARAKNKLRTAKIPLGVPSGIELPPRLHAVLHVVDSIFRTGGALCSEGLRLARLLTGLLPTRGETWSLLALLLLLGSRSAASGELAAQDRTLWDQALIAEGLGCLDRALGLGDFSVYALQASIAALHARARTADETDWSQLEPLYQRLLARAQSPEEALELAASVALSEGPARGLAVLEGLADDPSLSEHHLFYAARADLLRRVGQLDAAARDYTQALRLVGNEPERRYLARRLSELDT